MSFFPCDVAGPQPNHFLFSFHDACGHRAINVDHNMSYAQVVPVLESQLNH
jgi:hypothetical protein